MRAAFTIALLLGLGVTEACTQAPKTQYEGVFTRAKPLVFLGTVEAFHYEPAYQGKQLVVDVAVHEMAFGDSVPVVHLAPFAQIVPETNEVLVGSSGEGWPFSHPVIGCW